MLYLDKPEEIEKIITDTLRGIFIRLNNYFENIMNSPSTINRIITHYSIGIIRGNMFSRFILFEDKVVCEITVKGG